MTKQADAPHDTTPSRTADRTSVRNTARDDADAREFEAYARTQDAAELQAALWASRSHDGLDAAAQAEFRTWLAADASHGPLYEALGHSLDGVRQLPAEHVHALKQGLKVDALQAAATAATSAAPAKPRQRPASPGRRAWLLDLGRLVPQAAMAATAVGVVGGGWLGWDRWRSQPTFEKHYATARGQRLNVDLPDGSTLQLDAATQAEVRLYREHREVRLVGGQAMFIVSSNPAQPFHVLAGAARVVVVGTRFSVRHMPSGIDAGKTTVAVESGRVRVSGAALRGAPGADAGIGIGVGVELGAGQGVTADEAGRLAPVVAVAPGGVAAWRQGRVSFDDTPLAQALAEFERYGDTGLVVRDPAVGAMRLGGSFDLRQVGTFAQALPQLLPVRLERRGAVLEVVGVAGQ
ncbi:FecR family protein [Variovorax sp. RCC_210]|uniref:FecR family protein n=1 Tax=Variovorax sp. RCC_210 TaxID=3239217 RepID=UPI003523764B